MTGSVALDIVIGLIFIYLLYSLLATVVSELLANFLGLRARNLQAAIQVMLEDRKPKRGFGFGKLGDLLASFKQIFYNKMGASTKAFYEAPQIKYLSNGRFFSKPSYLTPNNFSKTILDMLKKVGEGEDELEKIKSALKGGINHQDQVKAVERILAAGGTSEEQAAAIKSLMGSLNNTKPLLEPETANYILGLIEDAQGDLEKFKAGLETWFNDTMERCTGWYKRNLQLMLLIIGFIIAVAFNASTTEIVKRLSKDPKAREQMVALATAYVENNPTLPDYKNKDSLDFKARLDTLLAIKQDLELDIEEANQLVGLGWTREDSLEVKTLTYKNTSPAKLNGLILYQDTLNAETTILYYLPYPNGINKKEFANRIEASAFNPLTSKLIPFDSIGYFWAIAIKNWTGYLLTAIAISLGAPFWFDLLNKLVKLRASVASGKEK